MGSESSDSGASGPDQARRQVAQQTNFKKQKQREERRVLQAEKEDQKGYYVRGGGNLVRSSSGTAVTSRAGAKVVDDYRSQEVEELYGDQKSSFAQSQLEKRLRETPFPGTLGVLQRLNLERQLKDLKAGGAPQFRRTSTGRYVAVGVNRPGQEGDSSPNIANSPAYSSGDDSGGVARRAVAAQESTAVQPTSAAQRALFQGLRQGAEKGAKRRQFVTPSNTFRA